MRGSMSILDTIQDFLKNLGQPDLGIKPHMHLVEIIMFSLHHLIIRPTKIVKDLPYLTIFVGLTIP
jgi:hypothetical protein